MENKTKVFVRKNLHETSKENKLLRSVIEDFKAYKQGTSLQVFGRDAPMHHPKPAAEMAEIWHAHIMKNPKTQLIEMAAVKTPYKRTSDRFLMYTRGFFNTSYYYVIDYIDRGAHTKVNDMDYMRWLIDEAENFRKSK